jgi:two-component system, NtrC family, response regulator AtoC
MLIRVLLLVRSRSLRERVESFLTLESLTGEILASPEDLWKRLQREDVELLIVGLPDAPSPPERWVGAIRELPERPDIIVLAEEEDPHQRAALLAAGAVAVLNVSLPDGELAGAFRAVVRRLQEGAADRLKAARLDRGITFEDFESANRATARVLATARRVARSDATLLLLGETGVGKERLARAIHGGSQRSSGPFIPLNCGALPEGLLESELFGHEKGAFTGAARARRGYFELAHGGTLFLDEIGDLPAHLQGKLLRALEDRAIQRLGGERPIRVDVRIMAATNRDLEEEVRNHRFRADLFYRLAVVSLTLPPLRERREEIPVLIRRYLDGFRRQFATPVRGIHPDALEVLTAYDWPGNVRELINVLERAVLLAQGEVVDVSDLPEALTASPSRAPKACAGEEGEEVPSNAAGPLAERPFREARREVTDAFEREYLSDLLRASEGRISLAAKRAGLNPRSLYALMKRHGLRREEFKEEQSAQ